MTPAPGYNVWLFCRRFGSNASSLNRNRGCKTPGCLCEWARAESGGGVRLFQTEAESARPSATTTLRDNEPRISQSAGTCHVSWCCNDMEENTWTQRTIQRLHNSSMLLSVTTRRLLWFHCQRRTTTPAHSPGVCSSSSHTLCRETKFWLLVTRWSIAEVGAKNAPGSLGGCVFR